MHHVVSFRIALNRLSVALSTMTIVEEIRYLDKRNLLGTEHTDLLEAADAAAARVEAAVDALPIAIAGADTWPNFRNEIMSELKALIAANDDCEFEDACRHMRALRDSVAVSRSYLAANESADTSTNRENPAGWSMDELARDLRANGIALDG